ncbi:MAG: hypothetical protein ACYTGN_11600 [Planctomycetota bacterium]|jgi:hypothetical protein
MGKKRKDDEQRPPEGQDETQTEHFSLDEEQQGKPQQPESPDVEQLDEPVTPDEPISDETQTESSQHPAVPATDGPAIELPAPEDGPEHDANKTNEVGPIDEVDPHTDTQSDGLRVGEFAAAVPDEPVSQPPAVPDSASGAQPSSTSSGGGSGLTKTDIHRPEDLIPVPRRKLHDQSTRDYEEDPAVAPTATEYGVPDAKASDHGIDPAMLPEDMRRLHDASTGDLDAAPPTASELGGVDPALLPDDMRAMHNVSTEDFEVDQTRTDFGETDPAPASGSGFHAASTPNEPLGAAPEPESDPDYAPDEPEPEDMDEDDVLEMEYVPTARERLRELWKRTKVFFRPKSFVAGLKEDFRQLLMAWKRSGSRKSSDLQTDHNADWWKRTFMELMALFAIIVPIEMAIGGVGSYGIHPHPYWLIVLPMAGARGVVAGLLAAGIASIFYVLGAFAALGHWDLFTFAIMTEPILFFGVGFFAGELHDELAARYRKALRDMDELRVRNNSLREQRDVLGDANKLLERRIVDQSVQFGNLVVAARRIESAGRSELFEIALEMVEEHCGGSSSVLLMLGGGGLDYLCHRGWSGDEMADRLAAARRSAFVKTAIDDGVFANGFAAEEPPPEGEPLLVAPLFDSDGVTKALLCLDAIPASRLNESTITIFTGIADWLGAALARLDRDDRDNNAPLSGPMGEVYLGRADELGERMRLELERCARYGVPTSLLAIQAPEFDDTTREGLDELDRYLCMHFTQGLRPSDSLYRFGYAGCYLLVLAGTGVEGAEVVRKRMQRRADYAPSDRIGPLEFFATGPDAEAPDLGSLVERVAKHFRDRSPMALDGTCPVKVATRGRVGGADEFVRRLRLEVSLAKRNGFPLFVVGIASETDAADPDQLARHVLEAGHTLRPTDGVFATGPNQAVLLLPNTGSEEAATVAHRLVQAVRARDPHASYGHIETRVMALGQPHKDAASFLQALARQGGTHG